MDAFLYGAGLQWKVDLRSRNVLIAMYVVPLLFLLIFGGVFTSVLPNGRETLLPMMTTFCLSMGALIGVPPAICQAYRPEIRSTYRVNGVPSWQSLAQILLAAFLHLLILAVLVFLLTPLCFQADPPESAGTYVAGVLLLSAASLGAASVIGLAVKDEAAASAVSIAVFLPSIMLSGIMFPADMLPEILQNIGEIFPATWGFRLMSAPQTEAEDVWPLILIICLCAAASAWLLRRLRHR